ncbi:MAG: signal peptidase II [Chloroflexi bacterium]|nr:signal peptidase II [Chloroflexota bacterium]
MKVTRNYSFLFIVSGIIIALDQWTKHLVRSNIPSGGIWLPENWEHLGEYFRIVHWHNTGAAFGIFQGIPQVFTILAFFVAIAIIWFYREIEEEDSFLRLALAMQLGGAVGNLVDRLFFEGVVTDWISVGNFAVFNVADASISVGTAIMLLGIWIMEKRDRAQKESDPENEQEAEPRLGIEDSI